MKKILRLRLTLLQKFSLVSFVLLAALGVTLAWGIQSHLESNALHQEADNTADRLTSTINPYLSAADFQGPLSADHLAVLDRVIRENVMRSHIVRVKVWSPKGLLLYSDVKDLIGRTFPVDDDLDEAMDGEQVMDVSSLDDAENVDERLQFSRLLEIYVPVQLAGSDKPVGVFEVYHDMVALDARIDEMRAFVWTSMAGGFLILYALLFTLVRNASRALTRRNVENARLYAEAKGQLAERKRAEEALRSSEILYRSLVETSPDAILLTDADGKIIFCNQRSAELHGLSSADEALGRNAYEFVSPQSTPVLQERALEIFRHGGVSNGEYDLVRADGVQFPGELNLTIVPDANGEPFAFIAIIRDITERRHVENALRRQALTFENIYDAIVIHDMDFKIVDWNPAADRLFGFTREEVLGNTLANLLQISNARDVESTIVETIQATGRWSGEISFTAKDGTEGLCGSVIVPLHDERGRMVGSLSASHDIKEHKRSQEAIKRQLERLDALRNIDMAIIGSVDLGMTLRVVLEQVVKQLDVDAADVLLLTPNSYMLECSEQRGFSPSSTSRASYRLGQGYAGRAAIERRTLCVSDVRENPDAINGQFFAEQGFVAYYAVPLVAKGQLKGVLEVCHRSALQPDSEWLAFLEALAGQAAIAVENAILFNDLERSNIELSLAYDTTLEGWSRALDLRDKETEGHTQRVTDMTLRLARAMHFPENEMVHMRRGALLHDIGKMGIPDAILLKPGPLTDAEWKTMRLHPAYANELLSPILFLRSALDIPYCHHEKWDGTGYPRGLKGDQIPLAARIFTVVDVWDALRSDRPYRAAWPEEKVRDYIQSLSGISFDPKVVEAFLSLDYPATAPPLHSPNGHKVAEESLAR